MYLPFAIMILAAIGMILGLFYRASVFAYFLTFTYIELIDKSTYLNHYYFVSLMLFLLLFVPANRDFSLDAKRNPAIQTSEVPFWTIFILQFQLGVVYFFAGIAKINPDWLFDAQPLAMWLQAYRDLPLVGNLLASTWVAYAFSWFGCAYDILIPFLLWSNRFRPYAYFLVVFFHVLTWALFPIGVFPWVMIFSTLIFFSEKFHLRILNKLKSWFNWTEKPLPEQTFQPKTGIALLLGIYIFFQLAIPFRYLLYPNPDALFWHEEGFRFSWRVMLMEKKAMATFYVEDPKTNGSIEIDNHRYLTLQQIDQMSRQPDMILQYAHFLGEQYRDTTLSFAGKSFHIQNPRVTADVFVTVNGRMNQRMVSRKWNLMNETYNLKHRTWLEPYEKY